MSAPVSKSKFPKKREMLAIWCLYHRKDARDSLRRLLRAPLSSLMTIFVIAVALLLPALLFLVNANLDRALVAFRQSARLTLYLEDTVSEAEAETLSEDLLTHNDIRSVDYISKQQALAEFSNAAGLTGVLSSLDDNPLPASLVITPAAVDVAAVEALAEELRSRPEVAMVQLDQQWIQRLAALASLLRAMAHTLGVIVIMGLGFIIGNTIKLGVANRKAEIQVVKLVGGTDRFIARPFLYAGLYYGTGGGVLAVLLIALCGLALAEPLQTLTGMTGATLAGLTWGGSLILILVGAGVGWAAALIASWHYIRAIDP